MLAITFGVAVVMAVAGPYLRPLEPEKKWQLLYSSMLLGIGMICATGFNVWRRMKIGQRCGELLVQLEMQSSRKKRWGRWAWLLVYVPMIVFFSYMNYGSKYSLFAGQTLSFLVPLFFGWGMAEGGLIAWAEGYSDSVDLCGNGITTSGKFYAWSSPKLRYIEWGFANVQLEIDLRWYVLKVPVPREQREAVDAILENYYRPQRLGKH